MNICTATLSSRRQIIYISTENIHSPFIKKASWLSVDCLFLQLLSPWFTQYVQNNIQTSISVNCKCLSYLQYVALITLIRCDNSRTTTILVNIICITAYVVPQVSYLLLFPSAQDNIVKFWHAYLCLMCLSFYNSNGISIS